MTLPVKKPRSSSQKGSRPPRSFHSPPPPSSPGGASSFLPIRRRLLPPSHGLPYRAATDCLHHGASSFLPIRRHLLPPSHGLLYCAATDYLHHHHISMALVAGRISSNRWPGAQSPDLLQRMPTPHLCLLPDLKKHGGSGWEHVSNCGGWARDGSTSSSSRRRNRRIAARGHRAASDLLKPSAWRRSHCIATPTCSSMCWRSRWTPASRCLVHRRSPTSYIRYSDTVAQRESPLRLMSSSLKAAIKQLPPVEICSQVHIHQPRAS